MNRTELNQIIKNLVLPNDLDANGQLLPNALEIWDEQDQIRDKAISDYFGGKTVRTLLSNEFTIYEKTLADAQATKQLVIDMGYKNINLYQPMEQDPNNPRGSIICKDTPYAVAVSDSESLVLKNSAAEKLLNIDLVKDMLEVVAPHITYTYGDNHMLRAYFNDEKVARLFLDKLQPIMIQALEHIEKEKGSTKPIKMKFTVEPYRLDTWAMEISFW